MQEPTFSIERVPGEGAPILRVVGRLMLANGDALLQGLRDRVEPGSYSVRIDLDGVESMDGAATALLLGLAEEYQERGIAMEFRGGPAPVRRILDSYSKVRVSRRPRAPMHRDFVEEVGRATAERVGDAKRVFGFAGQLFVGLAGAVRHPRTVQWRDLGHLMERAGADGVPIVVLINFLVGLIMGYQSAIQLERFGASIFIADLVGLSITRELGPLMTAIIVAGRTGAAYAAELGTMQVRQEIDALSTLSLDPARFLVFPRIVALAVVVPLLALLGDFVGCLGGLVVAMLQLDLTMTAYLDELNKAVDLWDVFGGLFKSLVFAVTIALVSCQRGLATRGGADAVGMSTTSAVVIILFALVTLDAIFAVMFNSLGI